MSRSEKDPPRSEVGTPPPQLWPGYCVMTVSNQELIQLAMKLIVVDALYPVPDYWCRNPVAYPGGTVFRYEPGGPRMTNSLGFALVKNNVAEKTEETRC